MPIHDCSMNVIDSKFIKIDPISITQCPVFGDPPYRRINFGKKDFSGKYFCGWNSFLVNFFQNNNPKNRLHLLSIFCKKFQMISYLLIPWKGYEITNDFIGAKRFVDMKLWTILFLFMQNDSWTKSGSDFHVYRQNGFFLEFLLHWC